MAEAGSARVADVFGSFRCLAGSKGGFECAALSAGPSDPLDHGSLFPCLAGDRN